MIVEGEGTALPETSFMSSHSMPLQVPVTLGSYRARSYLHGSLHHDGSCPSLLALLRMRSKRTSH